MFLGFTGILPFLGIIPAMIAERKGRSGWVWWLYGTTLFIVALPHALMLEGDEDDDSATAIFQLRSALDPRFRACPFCAEMIRPDAKVCRFCNRELPPDERLDEHASTKFLIENLRHRSDDAREKAIILLGNRGPSEKEALSYLAPLVNDPSRRIRIRAEWAIERISDSKRLLGR
jgi:hypothetical protein